jgi:hypothetical protein
MLPLTRSLSLEAKLLRSSLMVVVVVAVAWVAFLNCHPISVALNYIELVVIEIVILLLIILSNVKITK